MRVEPVGRIPWCRTTRRQLMSRGSRPFCLHSDRSALWAGRPAVRAARYRGTRAGQGDGAAGVGAGRRVRASLRGWLTTACLRLVEKKVAKLDGVTAAVNLATGVARVSHPALAIGSARTPLISRALAAGAAATGSMAWCLTGRERELFVVGFLAVATQVVLHALFSLAQAVVRPEPAGEASLAQRWVRYLLCSPPEPGMDSHGAAMTTHSMDPSGSVLSMSGTDTMDSMATPAISWAACPRRACSRPTWPPPCYAACGSPTENAPHSAFCGSLPDGSSPRWDCCFGCPLRRTALWEPSREHGYYALRHFYASEQLEAGEEPSVNY
jgi:hypothetical protein